MNVAAKLEKHRKRVDRPALATAVAWECARMQGLDISADWERLPQQAVAGIETRLDLVAYVGGVAAPRS